jgi:putative addiction module killer protein
MAGRSSRQVASTRITRQIDKLERGNFGNWRALDDGVAELKMDFGPGYRVYYARIGNTMVVLLIGGDKSSQSADIERARELWKGFQESGMPTEFLQSWRQE